VNDTLEDIRKSRAETAPVLEDRPAQNGDVATIDFKGFVDGKELENGAAEGHEIELGSNTFIPGFEEGLVGMKIGAEKTIQLSFPEGYHVSTLAGKPVEFKVTLKGLKKKVLPEINDEFAKNLGPMYQNLEDLKKAIREDFEKRESKRVNDDLKNRLMRVLVDHNPVEVPKALKEDQKKALVEDFKKRMQQQGMNEDQFEEYKGKWATDFEQTASYMIQSSFLIDKIAAEQDLRASATDVDTKLKEYAAQTGIELARVTEFYNEEDRRARLAYQITEEKVLEFLISKSDIKEVSREEIEKEESKET
jgi:trigger factor